MARSKYFDKFALIITIICIGLTLLFMNGSYFGLQSKDHTIGYENRLFDDSKIHSIDIVMNDWDNFIESAMNEEYETATLIIDGESYKNVGLRAKGNTSLSNVASMDSQRYSFKVEFDHYDSSLTYYGLDKLSLNNLIQDSTMMKDYLTYTLMNRFGVNSPLCSYVYITVNGQDWGLYLAVEGIEESFLQRTYGSNYGNLYKPDSMSFGGGRGNGKDFSFDDFDNQSNDNQDTPNVNEIPNASDMPDFSDMPNDGNNMPFDMSQNSDFPQSEDSNDQQGELMDKSEMSMPGGFGGFGGFGSSSDVKLQYIDDEFDSYSNIWNNAKTDITDNDKVRLIQSLKLLSNNESIDQVVDIEQVIRYFVVHNYVCNDDSYTGMMVHNYYLYEDDGQLTMIPWDYNLAFGTFSAANATSTVNTPIDNPVSGESDDLPMLNWIYENNEYLAMYHQYFQEFINSIDIQSIIDTTYNLIYPYVEKDPTAFYSVDEFEAGVETLKQFCNYRSESISQQLATGQTSETNTFVDASDIDLSTMGSMNSGGGPGGNRPNMNFDFNDLPEDFKNFNGTVNDNFAGVDINDNPKDSNQVGEYFTDQQISNTSQQDNNEQSKWEEMQDSKTMQQPTDIPSDKPSDDSMPNKDVHSIDNPMSDNTVGMHQTEILLASSCIVLIVGIIVVKIFKA